MHPLRLWYSPPICMYSNSLKGLNLPERLFFSISINGYQILIKSFLGTSLRLYQQANSLTCGIAALKTKYPCFSFTTF